MYQLISKKMSKKRKGFTLIELIVVIAILGILAAIAIPKFASTQETAKERAEESTLKVVQSAVRIHQADKGVLPGGTVGSVTYSVADFKTNYIGSPIKAPTSTANNGKVLSMDANGVVSYVAAGSAVTTIPYD